MTKHGSYTLAFYEYMIHLLTTVFPFWAAFGEP